MHQHLHLQRQKWRLFHFHIHKHLHTQMIFMCKQIFKYIHKQTFQKILDGTAVKKRNEQANNLLLGLRKGVGKAALPRSNFQKNKRTRPKIFEDLVYRFGFESPKVQESLDPWRGQQRPLKLGFLVPFGYSRDQNHHKISSDQSVIPSHSVKVFTDTVWNRLIIHIHFTMAMVPTANRRDPKAIDVNGCNFSAAQLHSNCSTLHIQSWSTSSMPQSIKKPMFNLEVV